MRIVDHVAKQGSKESREANLLTEPPPVIHAGDIAHGFYTIPKDSIGPVNYPWATPCFTECHVAWREADHFVNSHGEVFPNPNPCDISVQVLCYQEDRFREALQLAVIAGDPKHKISNYRLPEGTTLIVNMWPTFFVKGQLKRPPYMLTNFLRADGYVLESICVSPAAWRTEMEAKYGVQEVLNLTGSMKHIPFFVFSFANCRNVDLVDVTAVHAPAEKIRNRLRLPVIRSYTLKIKTKRRTQNGTDPQDVVEDESLLAHHLCRGSFAEYSAEKPLFGNPKNVGRFWRPPHVRGDKKNGQILKHYAIDGGGKDEEATERGAVAGNGSARGGSVAEGSPAESTGC